MADDDYRAYMSAGVRELHRLWNEGFGDEAPHLERENPGRDMGALVPIALIAGAAFIFRDKIGSTLSGLGSAIGVHAAAVTSGNPAPSPSSAAISPCGVLSSLTTPFTTQSLPNNVTQTGNAQTDLLAWWHANVAALCLGGDYPAVPIAYTEGGQTAYYLPGSGSGFVDGGTWQSAVSSHSPSAFPVWSGAASGNTSANGGLQWATALRVN